jgi:hypothetical protein
MPFDNPTNHGRVYKMVDLLDLIEASEKSNRAKWQETAAMLNPILARLTRYQGHPIDAPRAAPIEAPAAPVAAPKPGSHAAWNSVREMAEQAELADLAAAVAIFTTRLDDALAEMRAR